jgi:hypothetical protein
VLSVVVVVVDVSVGEDSVFPDAVTTVVVGNNDDDDDDDDDFALIGCGLATRRPNATPAMIDTNLIVRFSLPTTMLVSNFNSSADEWGTIAILCETYLYLIIIRY